MVKFLKRTLCIALSFAMMTGTVLVGAKTKTESIHSKLPVITAVQRVIIRHTMEDGVTIATSQCHLFQERQQTRKKGSK